MLETGIFCVILLAVGYWTAMYVMGRRADVIHGKFVHADDEAEFAPAQMPTPPPPFPQRPVKTIRPADVQPVNDEAKPVSSATLQSLLAAIQQDLKGVA
ncbi:MULTISPECIES: hypothetical protein [unclassified Bradyrhizobium]|uniref:hypothetical protein n=1 Tax=unclassified Bradyrhizobium TaxID=2631580 RepID=UPI002479DF99|nr:MULTISPECIES: hypothetical protein [unclassified Bradyrhizobium]WGR75164.1 hypothetical protein MTX24_23545 [Bradyrhizobium sp. ISRA426]WGR82666.1 hypothetical protein MTX21_08660 [Bradyrhizobium sp. ISRA430]WGR90363.1 hypothetical protein MTX25_23225 [Bradyrhizobium sp. ISRA432]